MSSHDLGWAAVNYPKQVKQRSKKIGGRLLATATAILLIGLVLYTTASADCATTGGSCTFANEEWFNWLATTVLH